MKVLVLNSETPSTKFFFALIKKSSYNSQLKYILDIIEIFLDFWDPTTTKKQKSAHMEWWVSKQDKKGAWSSFLKEFLENIEK